jgi:hypothetical protein
MFLRLFNGKLFITSISLSSHKILNIDIGINIWAIKVAESYFFASVIGIDIAPI